MACPADPPRSLHPAGEFMTIPRRIALPARRGAPNDGRPSAGFVFRHSKSQSVVDANVRPPLLQRGELLVGEDFDNAVVLPIQLLVDRLAGTGTCLLYTSPSPRDVEESRMPSSA